jgi:DNA-binding LacI/PurR family transcriptional regulator
MGNGKKLTLKDIAQEVGVSTATASRALAGNTAISEETRELVMQAAARVGYVVPTRVMRSVKSDLSEHVCVVFPVALGHGDQLANPFELSLLGGIGAALRERRRDFSLSWQTPYDDDSLMQFVNSAPYGGFIFFGQSQFHGALNQLGGANRPLVVWGVATEEQRYCSVGTDNFQGGFRSTKHLIRIGRKRIAFLGAMPSIETARTGLSQIAQRLEGYKAALQSEGIVFDPAIIQTPYSARFEGADGIDNLIESGISFDGVVAASDMVALSALQALKRQGMCVPEDVSVIGYDDIDVASSSSPQLSTVRQDVIKAGSMLVSKVLRMMDGHRASSERLATEIIIRGSCGA